MQTDLRGLNAALTVDERIPAMLDTIDAQRGQGGLQFLDREGQTVAW